MATAYSNDDELGSIFNSQAHESYHPDQVSPDYEGNNAIKFTRNVLKAFSDNVLYLDELRVNRSPMDTPATHAKKVAKAVDDAQRNITPSVTNARNAIAGEIKSIDAELDAAAGLKANPRFENAVLARFQSMKPADHAGAIDKMIAAGDMASLATLIDAPAIVSGIDTGLQSTIRDRVLRKIAPGKLAERAELVKADGKLQVAFNRSLGDFDRLKAGCNRFDAAVAAAEALANRAPSGFNQ